MPGEARTSRKKAPGASARLTPSETAVLALLPTYRTLAVIGMELGIGRPTVKTHVAHIYEKLGATNRADAVRLAEDAGLLHKDGRDRKERHAQGRRHTAR